MLVKKCRSFSFAPNEETSIQQKSESFFPNIYARKSYYATISADHFAIKSKSNFFIPRYYFENTPRVNCDGRGFSIIRNKFGKTRDRPLLKISHGIGVIGLGSFNWYHWLIEILPTAMLAENLPIDYENYPLLVPEEHNELNSFRESLHTLKLKRKIIPLLSNRQYQVKNFIIIDSPVNGPFNLAKGMWPEISDYRQNENVLLQYRSIILKNLGIQECRSNYKIFLSRSNGRRNYNQNELEKIAKFYGFDVVCPELLSFREQVSLFNSAKFVVGASGAAWANSLFCQKKTFGLTWTFPEYRGFCVYSNLTAMVGMELEYFFTFAGKQLKSTREAYRMDYHVNPHFFREKIELFLENSK